MTNKYFCTINTHIIFTLKTCIYGVFPYFALVYRIFLSIFIFVGIVFSSSAFAGSGESDGGETRVSTGKTIDETINAKDRDDLKAQTGIIIKQTPEMRVEEKRTIIKNLDTGIIEIFRAKDLRTLKELKRKYTNLYDRKAAYASIKKSLEIRYENYKDDSNKLLDEYYRWIIMKINTEIQSIDEQIEDERRKETQSLLQSLLDSLFK